MKRDMELIIEILKMIEDVDDPRMRLIAESDSSDHGLVQYHVGLMLEAGLIEARDHSSADGIEYLIRGLTWSGHDFLDAARDKKVWNKAKEKAKKLGSDISRMPIEVIKQVLIKAAIEMYSG